MAAAQRPAGPSDQVVFALLVVVVLLLGAGKVLWPEAVPVSALTIPAIIGGWRLPRRYVLVLGAVIAVVLVVELIVSPAGRSFGAAAIVVAVWLLAMRYARLRESWGLGARTGMGILLDLRTRVRAQGEPPEMGAGWVMSRALRSAGDEAFRGDFTLAHRDDACAQAMIVDVSGHGVDVAARAVQVAGAFGGLIGVVGPAETLAACNTYVVKQHWDREYATAVHAVVDERSGRVTVRCAGNPPPRIRRADGSWEPVEVAGPVLGLSGAGEFDPVTVTLRGGDALVLVSDGCLDELADDPWCPVAGTVDTWVGAGASAGALEVPPEGGSGDDQTVLVIARRDSDGAG